MKNTMMEKKNTVWKKALVLSSAMLMGISLMACGGKGAAKSETGKTEVSTESQKAGEKADEKKTEGKHFRHKRFYVYHHNKRRKVLCIEL